MFVHLFKRNGLCVSHARDYSGCLEQRGAGIEMDVDILAVYTASKSSPTEVQPKRGVWSKEEGHGAGATLCWVMPRGSEFKQVTEGRQ